MPSIWPQTIRPNPQYGSSTWMFTSADRSASVVFLWNPPLDSDSFPDVKLTYQKVLNLGASAEVLQVAGAQSPTRTLGKGGTPFYINRAIRDGLMALWRQCQIDGYMWMYPRTPFDLASSDGFVKIFLIDVTAPRDMSARGELYKCELEMMYLAIPSWT